MQQEENSSGKYQHLELQKRNLEKKVAVKKGQSNGDSLKSPVAEAA